MKAQCVKSPPAMKETQETQVQSLGQGGPLEEGMAPHSSALAWKIPWTEECVAHRQQATVHGVAKSRT